MLEFLRAAGEAIVAAVAFFIDAFTTPVERAAETEPLPDSATLVARFRARAAAGEPPPLSGRVEPPQPAAAPQPTAAPEPTPAPHTTAQQPVEAQAPPPPVQAAAPTVTRTQEQTLQPANAQQPATAETPAAAPASAPAPAHAPAPAPAPQQSGGVDRAAFEALHLAPTPAPALSPREELLEASPGRRGTVDRTKLEPFLERHRDEMRPPQSPQFEALPISPGRPDLVTHAPVATAPTATATATTVPTPMRVSPPPATPTPATAAQAAPEAAATWPELPAWPPAWDAPVPQHPPLRARLENAWYV